MIQRKPTGSYTVKIDGKKVQMHSFAVNPPMRAGELRALEDSPFMCEDGVERIVKAVETYAIGDNGMLDKVGLAFEDD